MSIIRRILNVLNPRRKRDVDVPVIDSVDVVPPADDWRKRKLAEAARKYGRPFKCAGGEMPRQVVVRDRVVIVDAERNS